MFTDPDVWFLHLKLLTLLLLVVLLLDCAIDIEVNKEQ
jgi:hypothetical protein